MTRTGYMGNSHLGFTPQAHRDMLLGYIQSYVYIFGQLQVHVLSLGGGVTSGSGSARAGGFFPDIRSQIPPAAIFLEQ